MTENQKEKDIENLLETFFTAGVTPDCAENPKDAYVLKGQLGLFKYCLCVFFKFKMPM